MFASRILNTTIFLIVVGGLAVWLGPEEVAVPPGPQLFFVEGVLAGLLFLAFVTRLWIVRPLRVFVNGMDLLKAQDFSSRLAKVGFGEADKIVDLFNQMMHQLKRERLSLREQNHFLDLLISISPMGILIMDRDEKIQIANRSATDYLGIKSKEAPVGKRLSELSSPLGKQIASLGKDKTSTVRLSDSMVYRCSSLSFMDNGFPHPFVLIEKLTEEVVMAERRTYEKVIRMMAHEVNNSVGGIVSSIDTVALMLEEESDPGLREMAGILNLCEERCSLMSKFITSFAAVVKIPDAKLRPDDLNKRLEASTHFLEGMCSGRQVSLRIELTDEPVRVAIDSVLFEQALINIVKNSIEGIESKGGEGEIRIQTSANPSRITVTDNGIGISEEVKSHLFTPFYTSKPSGHGLGLILISDVLNKHHCSYSLTTSAEDGLTRFEIEFPRHGKW